MGMFLDAAKHRLLPCVGWVFCSFLFVIVGWICGDGIGYLGLAMGWVEFPDEMFSELNFMLFLFAGGIVGLIIMHAIRIWRWARLHQKYMGEYGGWTKKHTVGIAIFDETAWLAAFVAIWAVLVAVL